MQLVFLARQAGPRVRKFQDVHADRHGISDLARGQVWMIRTGLLLLKDHPGEA
ncbi:MAG: hypothetical protein OP8BY_1207 [Candidatus Saccharicenans subterraneus]|uniref:Uncharacterized protein n=1 Tax=Candidatus Saccharicenans subterraneus TaxID=2508984 RepID=A0A3E2BPF8_9BACT|nr:MAG: hypothetical protein OP8BY_1207 [Candidatus Saccharicenans subterraneum]